MFPKMNDQQLKIVAEAEKTVTELITTKVKPLFVFHNLFHTQQVVKATKEMIDYYHINDSNQFILLIAAWFHDTGFVSGKVEGHEMESCRIAAAFLKIYHVDQQLMQRVSSCIRATRMPQTPTSFEEKIICDADLFNLGTELFIQMTNNLRLELQNYFEKEISSREWCVNNIAFLQSHKYFTAYCRQKLEPTKQAWLRQLQTKECLQRA
jgi:predicted metal-dependent HD superfamily phosphohydrolase